MGVSGKINFGKSKLDNQVKTDDSIICLNSLSQFQRKSFTNLITTITSTIILAKFDQTRRIHPFCKPGFEIFCNKIIVGRLVFKSVPPCVFTLLCLRICVTTIEYCLIGLKIKHHHYKGDYRRKINTT
jgi:hypothetical protein